MSLSPDRVEVVVCWLGQIVVVLPHAGHGGDQRDVVPLLHPVTAGGLVISKGVAVITCNEVKIIGKLLAKYQSITTAI